MEASAEIAQNSVNALLTDSESESEPEERPPEEEFVQGPSAVICREVRQMDGEAPLKSPFEEFAPPKAPPQKPPPPQSQPHRNVRFNGGLQSFSEEPEGISTFHHVLAEQIARDEIGQEKIAWCHFVMSEPISVDPS